MENAGITSSKEQIVSELKRINAFLAENPWFDFDILEAQGHSMTIVGSTDLTVSYTLAITFHDICYYQIPRSWHTDPTKDVFKLYSPESTPAIVQEVVGHTIQILVEDNDQEIFIGAESITVSYDEHFF